MTRDIAEKLVNALLVATGELNDNLFLVRQQFSEAMYQEYKKRTGQIMADIYLDLIKPIVKEYPDLDPGSGRSSDAPPRETGS
jgi:hypothetical protein